VSGRLEEIPGEEAFPAYLESRIAAFYERAAWCGCMMDPPDQSLLAEREPGWRNFDEPVTQAT
jgi:V/A-type H+-transporting ATPase subunit A